MYKTGLIYPTYLFFILDESNISSISDIKNLQNIANPEWYELLTIEINSSKGNEIISLLLNYFPNIIFRDRSQIGDLNISSQYIIDELDFQRYVLNFTICLNEFEDAINEIAEVAEFDKEKLIKELFLYFYKIYFIKIFNHVNFSSNIKINKGRIDFNKDLNLYKHIKKVLKNNNYEHNYDFGEMIDFRRRFESGFRVNDSKDLKDRLIDLEKHFKKNAMETFKGIIKNNLTFNTNITPYSINKQFKPLFKIVYSYAKNLKFDCYNEDSLVKANKLFILSLKK
jgi:hypothetical protein